MKTVTFTPNPAIDVYAKTQSIKAGTVSRLEEEKHYPGGKGVNVSRALIYAGMRTTALVTEGGLRGRELLKLLEQHRIPFSSYELSGETRENRIFEDSEGIRYKFNSKGPSFPEAEEETILSWALQHCSKGDIFHTGGSLPEGMGKSFYELIDEEAAKRGAMLALDPSPADIKKALNTRFRFLKANLSEISPALSSIPESINDVIEAFGFNHEGREIIISGGYEGALLFCGNKIYRNRQIIKKEGLCCCCGDTMFAYYISERMKGTSPQEAFRKSGAAGLACACNSMYALASPADVNKMLQYIVTEEAIHGRQDI